MEGWTLRRIPVVRRIVEWKHELRRRSDRHSLGRIETASLQVLVNFLRLPWRGDDVLKSIDCLVWRVLGLVCTDLFAGRGLLREGLEDQQSSKTSYLLALTDYWKRIHRGNTANLSGRVYFTKSTGSARMFFAANPPKFSSSLVYIGQTQMKENIPLNVSAGCYEVLLQIRKQHLMFTISFLHTHPQFNWAASFHGTIDQSECL